MADREPGRWSDAALIAALRGLEPEVAWPSPVAAGGRRDLAEAVRVRLDAGPTRAIDGVRAGWLRWLPGNGWAMRPARRALLIAVALLVLLAAIAGAAGIGLPGLRVLFGGGSVSPPPGLEPDRSPSSGAPGAAIALGDPVSATDPATLDARAGFHVGRPTDPTVGAPDAVYVDDTREGQVSLVWAARAAVPATLEPGVGLLLTEFRGSVDDAFYSKVVGSGTTVEPVSVGGSRGYWLSGDPHFFFYTGPGGVVRDERRWVGDALIWSDASITYRLESALGRATTIRIAESLR